MSTINNIIHNLYLHRRFFMFGVGIICVFVVGFFISVFFLIGKISFVIMVLFLMFDLLIVYNADKGISGDRILPEKMSNGDQNMIRISLRNHYNYKVICDIIEEIPVEFQVRDFCLNKILMAGESVMLQYQLRPTFRGQVTFGKLHVFVTSPIGLIKRRFVFLENRSIAVYPAFVLMQKYELLAFSQKLLYHGLKKVRRLGHTMEFENIKEYVAGDDFRTVNWKATAKSNKLMVNQYQDERAQAVYGIIDQGRVMKMPFDGLSLLDYAINACLAVSNIVLKKNDYMGFLSFSKKVENRVIAERKATQMQRIMEALYNVKSDFFESDYGRLYSDVKRNIPHRSLLLLFTNFETRDGMLRQLPYLKVLAKNHLLIVIFFQNTELEILSNHTTNNTQEIFDKIIAEKFIFEKKLIVSELKKYGIHSILTKPEHLTIDTINKYLSLKAGGRI
ncbi:MAG: DUF58 domain-containing protein [Saprospiraceae bacterium]|nr:DUF58 domain-containing protein [Saprospiraceae bacterium]